MLRAKVGVPPAIVFSQFPAAGKPALSGSVVIVYVSVRGGSKNQIVAEAIRNALLTTVNEELARAGLEADPFTLGGLRELVDTAAGRMEAERRTGPADLERAQQHLTKIMRELQAEAERRGTFTVAPAQLEVALGRLCPIWPFC